MVNFVIKYLANIMVWLVAAGAGKERRGEFNQSSKCIHPLWMIKKGGERERQRAKNGLTAKPSTITPNTK